MSADIKRLKEIAREESIEAKMKHILADIGSIDEKVKRLTKQRETLMQRYEELKDAKLIRDAKNCSTEQDWAKGNMRTNVGFIFIN